MEQRLPTFSPSWFRETLRTGQGQMYRKFGLRADREEELEKARSSAFLLAITPHLYLPHPKHCASLAGI